MGDSGRPGRAGTGNQLVTSQGQRDMPRAFPPSVRLGGGPPIRPAALNRWPINARIGGRGEIAQLVEHTTENRGVPGSNPGLAILRSPCNQAYFGKRSVPTRSTEQRNRVPASAGGERFSEVDEQRAPLQTAGGVRREQPSGPQLPALRLAAERELSVDDG